MIINDKFAYMMKNFKKYMQGTIPWTISVQEDMHLLAKSWENEPVTCYNNEINHVTAY